MLGAAPIGRRGVLLFAVALAAVGAMPATSEAELAPSEALVDVWALEVTPRFSASVRARLIARATRSGINTLVLNPKLSQAQKRRMASLARRFHLRLLKLRQACTSEVNWCAVVVRRPAAVERLARKPDVDLVVLRLRSPKAVPRLAREHELAAAVGTIAPLMLLPELRADSGFSRRSWRRAISAAAAAETVNLGVSPAGQSSKRVLRSVLSLLAARLSSSSADSGSVVFRGSFETGALAPWPGAQCANTGVASSESHVRGTITVQTDIVGEGNYAAQFDLPAADTSQACEALIGRSIGAGTNDYYGLMIRFPSDWSEPSPTGWGLAIAQLNFENIWGSPVALVAHGDRVALVMQSGLCKSVYTSEPGCAYSSGVGGNVQRMYPVPAPLALDVWHELIIRVHWATDSSGVLQAWHRLQGDSTWSKTVSLSGYPTLQWTADTGPSAIASASTVDKIGAYRGPATFPLTVWHDGFVRATSFAAAAAALP